MASAKRGTTWLLRAVVCINFVYSLTLSQAESTGTLSVVNFTQHHTLFRCKNKFLAVFVWRDIEDGKDFFTTVQIPVQRAAT